MQFLSYKGLKGQIHISFNKQQTYHTYEFTHYKWFISNHGDSSTREGDTYTSDLM
jgi:hypothetical protein